MKTAMKVVVVALVAAMLFWTIRPQGLALLKTQAAKNTVPAGSLIAPVSASLVIGGMR
jgi:hypothetical protein